MNTSIEPLIVKVILASIMGFILLFIFDTHEDR